jgi:hypothetical protein
MKFSRDICPACREKEQMLISQIVLYVNMHPGCNVEQISNTTGISRRKIIDLVHEGLLRRFGLKMNYPCRICGQQINKGNVCFWCADRLKSLVDQLKDSIWNDSHIRQQIESAGLRPDLREEDWEKAASLFSDSPFAKRRDRNVSGRLRRGGWYS